MSWLIAAEGSLNAAEKKFLLALVPEPLMSFESEQMFILAGGLQSTCLASESSSLMKGWIVCGTGIRVTEDSSHIMSSEEWDSEIAAKNADRDTAEGQYAGIYWQNGKIEGFVDRIGLRDLYCYSVNKRKIYSTRLDWVSALQERSRINFRTFGSRWLTFTQLSTESLLHGIERVKPRKPFEFPMGVSSASEFTGILRSLTFLHRTEGKRSLLGISGGLDSRVLLAIYASAHFKDLDLFTFGNEGHPDVRISKRICQELHLEQTIYDAPVSRDADFYVREISRFMRHSNVGRRASSYLHLQYYDSLRSNTSIVIDGAFGELARRQLLNRLLIKGRKPLRAGDPGGIFRHMQVYRGDFFSQEIRKEMELGSKEDIALLVDILPKISDIGPENWVDFFAVRAILPNVLGYEQSRTDHYVQSFMPFVQPSMLQKILTLPVKQKRRGVLFRRMIAENAPILAKFPLVAGNISYPYGFSVIPSYLWTKVKQRTGGAYHDPSGKQLLMILKEFILDRIHSRDCIDCAYYDHKKVTALAEGFYSGNAAFANELDWWLAFELWRSNVEAFQPMEHR